MTRDYLPSGILLFFVLFAEVTPAAAQVGKWEIEVHGGGMLASNPTDGTAALPAPGTPFVAVVGANTRSSRHEPSWYFGDGAVLLNEVNTALGVTARITALDAVLNGSAVERQHGGSVGIRVSRHITPRYAAEFTLDYARGQLEMTDAALAGIEASRATFASALNARIADTGQPAVSTATIQDRGGRQIFTTGALNIHLKTSGKVIPYATVGGGIATSEGDAPRASLEGNYRFLMGPASSRVVFYDETDTVNFRTSIDHTFVGVLGGGIRYAIGLRWGVRVDVRAHLSKSGLASAVDTTPRVATLTPAIVAASPTSPAMVWSNNPSTGVRSSLSESLDAFETFEGNGMRTQVGIGAGVFWRF